MRIIFWGNGERGAKCLEAVIAAGYSIELVVTNPGPGRGVRIVTDAAARLGVQFESPPGPNDPGLVARLKKHKPDLFLLAGYSGILGAETIGIPKIMALNLHGGQLPGLRGSSPMNWALIRGHDSFTLSVIKVNSGVDSGEVILDRTFPLTEHSTIAQLHALANEHFPKLLVEAVRLVSAGSPTLRVQDHERSGYYPLRFPEDGFILFDMLTAEEIHNRIRAQSHPYEGAFSFYGERKVRLLASSLLERPFYGEPGRIYRIGKQGLTICASDRCLLLTEAALADTNEPLRNVVKRYESLTTVRGRILAGFKFSPE